MARFDKQTIVIDGARLVDGTGNAAIEDSVVVIQGDRIVGSGPRARVQVPADADVVSGLGRTVLPGLIDVHVHDPSDANMALYVKNGITSIRFAGGQQSALLNLRDRIDRGDVPGPRIFSVGSGVDSTPHAWPGSHAADSAIEARRLVQRMVKEEKVDAILATHRINRPILKAIVDAAHELNIPVTGQTWATSAADAIAVGMDGLENTSRIPEGADFPAERLFNYHSVSSRLAILSHLWVGADWPRTLEIAHQLAEAGIALAPELVSFEGWAGTQLSDIKKDRDWPSATTNLQVLNYHGHNTLITQHWSPEDFKAQEGAIERYLEFCSVYFKAGGPLVAGTDMGFGGILLHRELDFFSKAGLNPLQVIRTATRQAASALGRDDLGHIAVGAKADLIVVEGNPLDNLGVLRDVAFTFVGGKAILNEGALNQSVAV